MRACLALLLCAAALCRAETARATDSAGRVQPFVPSWNPSGYLWNGVDRVGVTVEGA